MWKAKTLAIFGWTSSTSERVLIRLYFNLCNHRLTSILGWCFFVQPAGHVSAILDQFGWSVRFCLTDCALTDRVLIRGPLGTQFNKIRAGNLTKPVPVVFQTRASGLTALVRSVFVYRVGTAPRFLIWRKIESRLSRALHFDSPALVNAFVAEVFGDRLVANVADVFKWWKIFSVQFERTIIRGKINDAVRAHPFWGFGK